MPNGWGRNAPRSGTGPGVAIGGSINCEPGTANATTSLSHVPRNPGVQENAANQAGARAIGDPGGRVLRVPIFNRANSGQKQTFCLEFGFVCKWGRSAADR